MTERFNDIEEFSGISVSAGPSGDLAWVRTRLHLSLGLCAVALSAGMGVVWLVTSTKDGDDAAFANLGAVIALLLTVWVLAGAGLALAVETESGGADEARLRSIAIWSAAVLLVLALMLTVYAAWYVIVAVIIAAIAWKWLTS
ncbi:MAG: hypothetical protein ACYCXR_09510 [Coriobacteriia bacterium]